VSSELPRGWPLPAYQAQAVAARTFAVSQKYRRLDLPYHMESSVLDQVYHGVEREHALAEEAARTTRGLVLTSKRHLAQTYFHAACGGTTESALEGWGTDIEYLPGSSCERCMTSGTNRAKWSVKLRRKDVDKAFSAVLGGPVGDVKIVARTATGRVKQMELVSGKKKKRISGADFRRLLGWSVVWSTQIDRLTLDKNALVVDGRGSGHGVGMCQWGAKGYGDDGVPFDEILARYYPGAALMRLY
jgi:stage II sporulation protein D